MERERPNYLDPITKPRWEFPWMALWAVLLIGMAAAGIWLHTRTNDAWSDRFEELPAARKPVEPAELKHADADAKLTPMVEMGAVRAAREAAERKARSAANEVRCIDGIAFRRIEGGWENVPSLPCP